MLRKPSVFFVCCAIGLAPALGSAQSIDARKTAELFAKIGTDSTKLYLSAKGVSIPRSTLPPERQSALIESTLENYAEQQNLFYAASTSVRATKIGVEAAFGAVALYGVAAATVVAPPVGLTVAAVLASSGVGLALDTSADMLDKAAQRQGQLYLAGRKEEILKATGMRSFDEIRGNLDLAKQRFKDSSGQFEDLRSRSVGNQNARDFAIDITFDSLTTTVDTVIDGIAQHEKRLDSVEKGLGDFVEEMAKYKDNTDKRLNAHEAALGELSTKVADLQQSIGDVDKKVSNLGRDQAFIADFVLDQMPPDKKVEALQGGFLKERFVCPADKQDCDAGKLKDAMITRFQREADVQHVLKTASAVVNGLSDVANIAANLGIEMPPELNKAVEIGNSAMGAFAAFSSGNPLGAVAAITGIFGSKKDPAEERHKAMLAFLTQQFAQINMKLDVIIENQKKIFDAVLAMNAEMRQGFASLDRRLDKLQFDVDGMSNDIRSLIWAPWASCNAVYVGARTRGGAGGYLYLSPRTLKFSSFDNASVVGHSWLTEFTACKSTIVQSMSSFNALQWFGNFLDARRAREERLVLDPKVGADPKDVGSILKHYEEDVFQPARTLSDRYFAGAKMSSATSVIVLSTPAPTLRDFEAQIASLTAEPFSCASQNERMSRARAVVCAQRESEDVIAGRLIERPLLADIALDVANWVLVIAQLADINDGHDFYSDLDALVAARPNDVRGSWLIDKSIFMMDLVVASYNQVYGAAPAFGIVGALDAAVAAPADDSGAVKRAEGAAAIALLKRNPYLAENVASILLDRSYRAEWRAGGDVRPTNEKIYRKAWTFAEASKADRFFLLNGLIPGLEFSIADNTPPSLVVKSGAETIEIPLPPPDEFANGRLVYPPRFYAVLKMRDQLVDRYLDYGLLSSVPAAEREQFALTLLR